jgi:putative tricarboxylic transport membrane protein
MASAVIRGDVDVAFEFCAALDGLLADGKLVAIACAGLSRAAYLPNVPAVTESGLKDYEVTSWNGLYAPAGTPPAIIASLNQAVEDVIPSPDIHSKAGKMGITMRRSTPEEMTARLKADIAKWGEVIDKAGIAKRD